MKKILNFRPFFYFGVVFACGIAAVRFFCLNQFLIASILIGVLIVIGLFALLIYKKRALTKIILLSAAFLIGCGAMGLQTVTLTNRRMHGETGVLTGIVTDTFTATQYYGQYNYNFVLRDGEFVSGEKAVKLNGNVRCKFTASKKIEAGDKIRLECTLRDIVVLKKDAATSNYRNRTFWEITEFTDLQKAGGGFQRADEAARTYIKTTFNNLFDEAYAGTAIALILGDMSQIDDEATEAFRLTGVTHIFSVSGFNVVFVVVLLNAILKKLKLNKTAAFFITAAGVFFYAWLCRFEPSVMRATVMTFIVMFARATGRQSDILSSLGLSAFAILLFRPLFIADYGFLLSFASVFGIATAGAALQRASSGIKSKFVKSITTSASICFGASAGTFPIIILLQGGFPIIGLFYNIVVLPLVTVVFLALMATLLPFFYVLAVPLQFMLEAITSSAMFLADVTSSWSAFIPMQSTEVFYFALLLIAGGFVFLDRKRIKAVVSVLVLCVCVTAAINLLPSPARNEVHFIDDSHGTFVVRDTNGNVMVFTDLQSYKAGFLIEDYCKDKKIKEINLYVTDLYKGSSLSFQKPDGVKINTIYLLGYFDADSLPALKKFSTEIVRLDFGEHFHGIRFETYGKNGSFKTAQIYVGGVSVLFAADAAFENLYLPAAEIMITKRFDSELLNFFPDAKSVSLELTYDKNVYCPAATGNFTLRVNNGTISAVY